MFTYREDTQAGRKYRQDYLDSLNKLIDDKRKEADMIRYRHFCEMIKKKEEYRTEFKNMLGWPLTEIDNKIPEVKREFIFSENGINIYRMQFNILGNLKFYGIYFESKCEKPMPLVIAQHGGRGTPELCSGFFGDSANYNGMVTRVLKYGVNVFAPQLLLWDKETYGTDYDRAALDAQLKQIGSSITSVEIYGIMKSIDYLSSLENTDSDHIGMIGLSYGGFYTLFTAAVDTRIKAALSYSQYNNRYEYSWTDWTWFCSAQKFLDNEAAILIHPRHLFIEVGDKDELFDYSLAQKEYEKLLKMCDNTDWVEFKIFHGTHEVDRDDVFLDKFMQTVKK